MNAMFKGSPASKKKTHVTPTAMPTPIREKGFFKTNVVRTHTLYVVTRSDH
jgi:hypothetical protein